MDIPSVLVQSYKHNPKSSSRPNLNPSPHCRLLIDLVTFANDNELMDRAITMTTAAHGTIYPSAILGAFFSSSSKAVHPVFSRVSLPQA